MRYVIYKEVPLQKQNLRAMIKDTTKYEEWLTTIANTRLIYNTMDELEKTLDNYSIHSNGIKRCFTSQQKMRSAYRDLKGEVELMTDGIVNLDHLILDYQKAWNFFRDNLYRRANPEKVAIELLSFCYPPYNRRGIGTKRTEIYQQVIEQNISVPFLLLMLMKSMPGYDSKDGDAVDMALQFGRVMALLQDFTGNNSMFSVLPSITRAMEETNKSRLMLLFHVSQVLDTYESFADPDNIYDTSNDVKASHVNLDIVGYWNECGGKLDNTDFWQIEDAVNYGAYFMTHWHKDADNCLNGIRYALFILEGADGGLIYYILHPEAIKHRMEGIRYEDADQVWYKTDWLDERPNELPLRRLMYSTVWQQDIMLTRCTDENVVSQYDRWMNGGCEIVKPYQQLEYYFRLNLYAVTKSNLYITSENEGEFYKIPREAYEGFERIQINDNVGTIVMNGKTFLAFDELMLYISTTKKELQKYKIERVNCIE